MSLVSSLSMAHYQVRGWPGWHQHMDIVALAMLFALNLKLAYRESAHLFMFLDFEFVDTTNYLAGHQLRPAVIVHKLS